MSPLTCGFTQVVSFSARKLIEYSMRLEKELKKQKNCTKLLPTKFPRLNTFNYCTSGAPYIAQSNLLTVNLSQSSSPTAIHPCRRT